jgi:hypothetical protein
MNKYFLLTGLLLSAAFNLFAQETFLLKNASLNFDVKITVEKCENDICEGKGAVYLMKKNQTRPFQTIPMPNLFLELGDDRRPTANLIELYGMNNSGVIFDDFNFDGAEDLALRNGNEGGYGGPSYDVLLFQRAPGKFVKSRELTRLASDNLGMFEVDKKRRTIETFTKSGCCWHQTARYKIVRNRPVKVYVFTEDATGGGDKVRLITEQLVGGRWKKTVKTALIEEYYKEQ